MNAELLDSLANESRSLLAVRHLAENARRTGRKYYLVQAALILETVVSDLEFLSAAMAEQAAESIPTDKAGPPPAKRKGRHP